MRACAQSKHPPLGEMDLKDQDHQDICVLAWTKSQDENPMGHRIRMETPVPEGRKKNGIFPSIQTGIKNPSN